jgi:hypothetical protein
MESALAYHGTELLTAVKCFITQARLTGFGVITKSANVC